MPVVWSHPLARYASVTCWLGELGRRRELGDAESHRLLEVLGQFADYVSRTPDEMVRDLLDEEQRSTHFGRRRDYAQRIDDFQAGLPGREQAQVEGANVVRSFFIHNGVFLGTPLAPWLG